MPSMMVVADLHIDVGTYGVTSNGLNTAWRVAHKSWMFSVGEAIRREVDVLVVLGDMFDTGRPWVEAIQLFKDGLDLAASANLPVVLVGGNHELSPREVGHRHILEQFSDIRGVHVAHSVPGYLALPGCNLVVVPWPDVTYIVNNMPGADASADRMRMQHDWIRMHLDEVTRWADQSSFLVGHLMMDKTKFNSKLLEQSARLSFPSLPLSTLDGPWTGSILGHIHLRQNLSDKISYAGCPWTIIRDDAETGPHGPTLITWDESGNYTNELIPGPDRKLLVVEVQSEADVRALKEECRSADDTSVVMVELHDRELLRDVQEAIPARTVRNIRTKATDSSEVNRSGRVIEHSDNPIHALQQWMEQEGLDEETAQHVMSVAGNIWDDIRARSR